MLYLKHQPKQVFKLDCLIKVVVGESIRVSAVRLSGARLSGARLSAARLSAARLSAARLSAARVGAAINQPVRNDSLIKEEGLYK